MLGSQRFCGNLPRGSAEIYRGSEEIYRGSEEIYRGSAVEIYSGSAEIRRGSAVIHRGSAEVLPAKAHRGTVQRYRSVTPPPTNPTAFSAHSPPPSILAIS